VVGVAVRCPFGRPAVTCQAGQLEDGTPFPTTFYLTCPHAVARVSALESAGGVGAWESRIAAEPDLRRSYDWGAARQRALHGGRGSGGIAGTARDGAVKCLHAHVAFALAEPEYALGASMARQAGPLFPDGRCCSA
jgi:hypothetical protein